MPRDPRRFRGRSRINIRSLLGAFGGADGGDLSVIAPGDVDYTDETFDARTQTRFQPTSPVRDFLSGGKATARANQLNTQQIINDQTRANALADAIESEKRAQQIRRDNAAYDATQKLKLDDLIGVRRDSRLGADLLNKEILTETPDATADMLYDEESIQRLKPEYISKGRVKALDFGQQLQQEGLEGAPSIVNARNTETKLKQKLIDTPKEVETINLGNGMFARGDVLTVATDDVDELGLPTGKKSIKRYSLLSGKEIIERPQSSGASSPTTSVSAPAASTSKAPPVEELDEPYFGPSFGNAVENIKENPITQGTTKAFDFLFRAGKRPNESWAEYRKRVGKKNAVQ